MNHLLLTKEKELNLTIHANDELEELKYHEMKLDHAIQLSNMILIHSV